MNRDYQIFNEDWITALAKIEPKSVQCAVTSPPYWGLRDYGVRGQLGLEKTPEEYISKLVAGFNLLRNALAEDGILWVNLGDSYAGSGMGSANYPDSASKKQKSNHGSTTSKGRAGLVPNGLKPKDLCMIPARVAIALQMDGWYLRSDIIWSKPNPMPESVTDRPTKSHEHIFLLSKKAKYYYDAEAIKEDASDSYANDKRPAGILRQRLYENSKYNKNEYGQSQFKQDGVGKRQYTGFNERYKNNGKDYPTVNRRDVWNIVTGNCPDAHFATFPEEIPRLCIAAGSKKGQIILDPFAGSGTTGEVALRMGRKFIGIELNEKYVNDLIIPRLENIDPLFRTAVV